MDFHNRQYDPQLGRFLSVDPLADAGGQQVLSPYHAMACNPVSMMDPLGLQVFGPANPMTVQDPAAMARAIAPTLLSHMPGGGLWDMSNMTRYIANLPKDLQAEAWMLYLSGGATGASTFQSRLGDLLTERAAKGNDRKGSWASDVFSSFVLSIENGQDVFDADGNLMTFLDEQQVYGFNFKNSIFERWEKWLKRQGTVGLVMPLPYPGLLPYPGTAPELPSWEGTKNWVRENSWWIFFEAHIVEKIWNFFASLSDMKKNPPDHPDYKAPKSGTQKVKNPNGSGSGWPDKSGDVWVPTDHKGTHAPHWDVQHKDGSHTNVYPID